MIRCLRFKALDSNNKIINLLTGKRLLQVQQELIVLMDYMFVTQLPVTQAQQQAQYQFKWRKQRCINQLQRIQRQPAEQVARVQQQQVVKKEEKEEIGPEGGLSVADPTDVQCRTVAAEIEAALEEGGWAEPGLPWPDIVQEGLASAGPTSTPTVLPLVGGIDVRPWQPDKLQEGLALAGPFGESYCHHVVAVKIPIRPDIREEGLASAGPTHMIDGCSGYAACLFFIWPFITQEGPVLAGLSGPEVC